MAKEHISYENLSEYDGYLRDDANILKRSTDYVEGNIVNKGQVFLKCTQSGKTKALSLSLSGVSVGDTLADGTAEWEVVSINGIPQGSSGSGLEDWKPNHLYKENDIFVYDGQIYKALVGFTSGNTFGQIDILEDYTLAGETPILWAEGVEITTNDIVEYDGNYYKALIDFTCGKEFTKTAFEEYVPKSLTDEEVKEVINSYTPEFSGGTGGEDYSTTEQRIGTWIDGKPLYKVTLVGTCVNNFFAVSVASLSIDDVYDINGVVLINGTLGTYYLNSNNFGGFWYSKQAESIPYDSVYVSFGNDNSIVGLPYYITIKYTKTTD